jgi:hypothetical protein
MQVALLQLGDIHIKTGTEAVLSRATSISRALHESAPHAAACVVVISGDVAFSGSRAQYEASLLFFADLRTQLLDLPSIKRVDFIAVPGNHDCDFTNESDIRSYLLKDVVKLYESDLKSDSDIVRTILQVQKDFFSFEATLADSKEISYRERLRYERLVQVGNFTISFSCFNTAWLSRKEEIQGKLFLPPDSLAPSVTNANISISVMHHPYNWLDAHNYRNLKDFIEQTSDIVFTGHEHIGNSSATERLSGEHLLYVEGWALQGEQGELDSGFNALVLDFAEDKQRIEQFKWNGEFYSSKQLQELPVIIKNHARKRHLLRINSQWQDMLAEVGTAFHHKRKRNLKLADIFIYPDFQFRSLDKILKESNKSKTVYSKDALEKFRSTELALVVGADNAGKTSLTKMLFLDFSSDFAPLHIDGMAIGGKISEGRLRRIIETAIEEQYDKASVERYMQLDSSRRLLLIDNFHHADLSPKNQQLLMNLARNIFGRIVVTVSDMYRVRELTFRMPDEDPFFDFAQFEIKEFGHRLRGRLISKWLSLGRESATELATLDQDVRTTEKVIASLLGRNVVPSTPFTIVSLLHMMESSDTHATRDGSYGTFYELLIRASLGSPSIRESNPELKSSYASVLAYHMYKNERTSLSDADLKIVHDEYRAKYEIRAEGALVIRELVETRILERVGDTIKFKYPHFYFYFVAKYFERGLKRLTLEADELRRQLRYMADRLHNEELSNIILFYIHLSQDWDIISYVLANAKRIYSNRQISKLEEDVEFANLLLKGTTKLVIAEPDIEKRREEYNRRRDEAESEAATAREQSAFLLDGKRPYDESLADIHKSNIAFKTLQVLGEVLRSSAHSLDGQAKFEIATECYLLGLRTLGALMDSARVNIEGIRTYLTILIRDRAALTETDLTTHDVNKLADQGVVWVTHHCAYGTIKHISYSVGHPHLEETYARIIEKYGRPTSLSLVDLAIKLEHFSTVPEYEITALRDKVVGNMFGYSLLRQLIGDFLYLYRVDTRTSQKLGSIFKIDSVGAPEYLLPDNKKT